MKDFTSGADVLVLSVSGDATDLASFLAAAMGVDGAFVLDADGDGLNVIILQGIAASVLEAGSLVTAR